MNIAYYVSNHGFGHISRSYEIIKYLLQKEQVDKIFVCTKRREFINENLENLFFRDVATDVGIVQKNSLSMDISNTLESILNFEKSKTYTMELEIDFLEREKIDCIISDCSSFPFVFADKLKLPSYCISNFTWDFIYENYSKYNPYFQKYALSLTEEYSLCKLGLILPFSCPVNSIKRKKNIGIIGRSTDHTKKEIRNSLGFSEANRYFLFSFGAYGIDSQFNFSNLNANYYIVTSGYEHLIGERVIDIKNIQYPELVKACDYVLTKPGYGILSETYLANTPVIYTDRGDFAEYEYLLQAMKIFHLSAFISQSDLLSLTLESAITSIEKQRNQKIIANLEDGREEISREIF